MCAYYGAVGGLSGTAAIGTIACISVERYLCVSRPLDPNSRTTGLRGLTVAAFIWGYAAAFSFAPLLFPVNR